MTRFFGFLVAIGEWPLANRIFLLPTLLLVLLIDVHGCHAYAVRLTMTAVMLPLFIMIIIVG